AIESALPGNLPRKPIHWRFESPRGPGLCAYLGAGHGLFFRSETLPQDTFEYFAGRVFRELRRDVDFFWNFEAGQTRAGVGHEFFFARSVARHGNDAGDYFLNPVRIGQPNDRDFGHTGMLRDGLLYFLAGDVLAAALDHVFLAVEEIEPTMFVTIGDVAGMVPAAAKESFVGRGVLEISGRDARTADDDFSGFARLHVIHLIVDDAEFQGEMLNADRIGSGQHAPKVSSSRVRTQSSGLGLPPAVDP